MAAQQAGPARSAPLIPHWIVVVIAGGLLVAYMTANTFTGGEAVGLAIILGIGTIIVLAIRALVWLGEKRPAPIVVNAVVAQAPPGWYLDPLGATRRFDGQR